MENKLNTLLATYQLHYQNLRSLHWNVKGSSFFELHLKYEELYTRIQIVIDDIAERLLTLEINPLHSYSAYIKASLISEIELTSDGKAGITHLLNSQSTLLKLEKEILELATKSQDEGTSALMSDLIREKEKTNWMFKAFLNH
jgi:starvation-inducible DNA-binding protein